ncbi:hypothetical protein EU555_26835 [Methylobacterium nonmethylotrophicum]|uniref:Uncharacterized protein n=1 Tax=Methylobacterium nonmethylotrophicum TaxID=1141884 RepID=A0A4Z0NHE3_9HYPH|nr:hypothetical protein EU555_26835 [Methylobacterium nonmethylotrophicum]
MSSTVAGVPGGTVGACAAGAAAGFAGAAFAGACGAGACGTGAWAVGVAAGAVWAGIAAGGFCASAGAEPCCAPATVTAESAAKAAKIIRWSPGRMCPGKTVPGKRASRTVTRRVLPATAAEATGSGRTGSGWRTNAAKLWGRGGRGSRAGASPPRSSRRADIVGLRGRRGGPPEHRSSGCRGAGRCRAGRHPGPRRGGRTVRRTGLGVQAAAGLPPRFAGECCAGGKAVPDARRP